MRTSARATTRVAAAWSGRRRCPDAAAALAVACLVVVVHGAASATDLERARALFEEGKAMLKEARSPAGDPIGGSHAAIEKLKEAAGLLEDAPDGSSAAELLQGINSFTYWARKTTPIDIRALLRKATSGGSDASSMPASSSRAGPGPAAVPSNPAEAAAALARAEAYARSHPDDAVTCAARFFEVADRYKDVHDVAFRAISRTQEFQRLAKERKALREAEAKFASLPMDERLVVEGDRAFAEKEFEKAALLYLQAKRIEETAPRLRKLGHALFGRAQELRAEYTKAYLAGRRKYAKAKKRNDVRGMTRARNEALQAGRIAKKAISHYQRAEATFQNAWRASGRADLDSELHMALCLLIRREPRYVVKAREILERILLNYCDKLTGDEERTLYACAETYAGAAAVQRARWKIARRAGASVEGAAGEARDERAGRSGAGARAAGAGATETGQLPPREMSDGQLRRALADVGSALRKDEHRLNAYQAMGRFDRKLLDRVNAGRERVKVLTREAEKRGLR